MSWPTLEIVPVALPTLPGHDLDLWAALIELASLRPGEWSLVGGQMVFLHAMEHGVTPPRVSTDLDVLVNARVVAGGVRQFVLAIEGIGFELDGVSPDREQGCRSPGRRCAGGTTTGPSAVAVSGCRSAGDVGPDDCEGPYATARSKRFRRSGVASVEIVEP